MRFRASRNTERLVGTLDSGEDIVEVLTSLCRKQNVGAGAIRASGYFDELKLVRFDPDDQSWQPVVDGTGQFELVSLDGSVSRLGDEIALKLDAVVNVSGPAGVQTVAGQLREARVVDGEFVIEVFRDLEMERSLDAETGRLVLADVERNSDAEAQTETASPPPEPTPEPSSGAAEKSSEKSSDDESSMSWDEAVAEAEHTEKVREKRRNTPGRVPGKTPGKKKKKDPYADFDFDEPLMSANDILDHKKLGECRILEVQDDDYVRVRLPRGGIRKLMLGVLDIEFRGEENGKKVFEAKVRR